MVLNCWKCGHREEDSSFSRSAQCSSCRWDLRSCKNCEFYDVGAHHECRESQSEWISDKEKGNFCDYFKPACRLTVSQKSPRSAALAAAEALFKKK